MDVTYSEWIFLIYLTVLVGILCYVTFRRREFIIFSHYPMFSKSYAQSEYRPTHKIFIERQNQEKEKWRNPVYYGRSFTIYLMSMIRRFINTGSEIDSSAGKQLAPYISAILSTLPKSEISAIHIMEKCYLEEESQVKIVQTPKYKISIINQEKNLSWTISSLK